MAVDTPITALLERLDALETRVAFQEDWLDTLDQTLIAQQRQIERLERHTTMLQHKLRDQNDTLSRLSGNDHSLDDERPPHY